MEDVQIKSSSRVMPLIGALLVVASIALYIFFARGLAAKVAEADGQIESQQTEIETLDQRISQLKESESNLGLTTQVEKFEILKSVPASLDQDEIIRDLINVSKSHDIQLHSLSFGKGSSSQEDVSVLRINASFEGNYNDLIGFLEGIEQNARMLRVSSINVQINTLEVSTLKRATFSLAMDAYYQN